MLQGQKVQLINNTSAKVARMALAGTDLEPLLRLHVVRTSYLVFQEPDVAKMFKIAKKMPTFVLLGMLVCLFLNQIFYWLEIFFPSHLDGTYTAGVMEGRLLTKSQLVWCSTLPSLDLLRAELCSILSASTSRLSQNLTYHQQDLSRSLQEHAKLMAAPAADIAKDSKSWFNWIFHPHRIISSNALNVFFSQVFNFNLYFINRH